MFEQQIVYRNKTNLLYLFRRKCLLYHLLALICSFIQKQQEKGFCVKNSQGQGFLFFMLAASSLTSLTTISKSISNSNLIANLQGDSSQLQVSCSEHRTEKDFRTKLKVLYCLGPCSWQSPIKLIKPTKVCQIWPGCCKFFFVYTYVWNLYEQNLYLRDLVYRIRASYSRIHHTEYLFS